MHSVKVLTVASKQQQILSAALQVFGRYGYRRTSMELIANAANVSRPLLYQYFHGKEDVFRAMAGQLLDGLLATARLAADDEGSAAERLLGILSVKFEFVLQTVDMQYRSEILSDAEKIAGDLLANYEKRMLEIIEDCVLASRSELDLVGKVLSAHDTAALLHDAVNGILQKAADPDTLYKRLHDLVVVTAAALSSRIPPIIERAGGISTTRIQPHRTSRS